MKRVRSAAVPSLLDEARATSLVRHPNVVVVLDAGAHRGDVFIAFEYIEGTNLRRHAGPDLPRKQALALLRDIAAGLAAAARRLQTSIPSAVVGLTRNLPLCTRDNTLAHIGAHMPYLAFNPFNPFSHWAAAAARPVYPHQPRVPAGEPIAIKPRNSDPGMSMTAAQNSVTISGTATHGARVVNDLSGDVKYEVARGMSFTLDIDKAPTVDIFGKTNFTEKNSRIFTLDTAPGWSAQKCAEMLAAKVNKGDDFRARVVVADDKQSATIDIERR